MTEKEAESIQMHSLDDKSLMTMYRHAKGLLKIIEKEAEFRRLIRSTDEGISLTHEAPCVRD